MQLIGTFALGAMALVNTALLIMVMAGLLRRTKIHH
jgi:hypothetical protein